jgi:hypothetical protein
MFISDAITAALLYAHFAILDPQLCFDRCCGWGLHRGCACVHCDLISHDARGPAAAHRRYRDRPGLI